MGREWTEGQKRAIASRKGNFLVSAGAGSGKTAVLTERIKEIVMEGIRGEPDGAQVSELLVLTFTKKAAEEMKSRIREAVIKALRNEPGVNLDKIASDLETADITTFDSYFYSLTKRYRDILGLGEDLQIGEGPLMEYAKKRLLDELFDELYEKKDASFLSFIDGFADKDDSSPKDIILSVYAASLNELEPGEFLEKLSDVFFGDDYIQTRLRPLYYEEGRRVIGKIEKMIDESLWEAPTATAVKKSLGDLFEYMEGADPDLAKHLNEHNYSLPSLTALKLKKYKEGKPSDDQTVSEEEAKRFDAFRGKVNKSIFAKYRSLGSFEEGVARHLRLKPYAETIARLALELYRRFGEYKRAHNLYEYADDAAFARKILKTPGVGERIRKSYKYVMVDEYQDTSDLQEEFLRLITDNNLFAVGDVKQSIYRFRNANPKIFLDRYARYEKGEGGTLIVMNDNFRSSRNVIEDVNRLFSVSMTEERGGIRYDDNQALKFGNVGAYGEGRSEDYETSILPYHGGERGEAYAEAHAIALDIGRRVGAQEINKKEKRPLEYGDFAILAKTKADFAAYQRAFADAQIPLVANYKPDLAGETVSMTLRSFLRLYLSYGKGDADEKHAYLSIRRSYLYRDDDAPLFQSVMDASYRQSGFYLSFASSKALLSRLSVTEGVDFLLSEFPFLARLPVLGDVAENYEKLMVYRAWAAVADRMGLSFEEFATAVLGFARKKVATEADVPVSSRGAVSLMSIHASKGLEFPVVYLSKSHGQPFSPSRSAKDIVDRKLGLLLEPPGGSGAADIEEGKAPSLLKLLHASSDGREAISEGIRLLYVAWTRAGQRLILTEREEEEKQKSSPESFLKIYRDSAGVYGSFPVIGDGAPSDASFTKEAADPPLSLTITRRSVSFPVERISPSRPSKESLGPMDYGALQYGTKMHRLLELASFKGKDLSFLPEGSLKGHLAKILSLPHFRDLSDAREYHEYAYYDEETRTRGSIDLLLLFPDHAEIIDFKSSKTDDPAYDRQLAAYAHYVEKAFGLPAKAYLLSLRDATLEERVH